MFTGLVQSVGQLQHLSQYQLKVTCAHSSNGEALQGDRILQDIALGDSIAVDGVCLTVEKILSQGFIAAVSPETLSKSTLGKVVDNGYVNLESSLRVGSKIGGHFVTGHVDGMGRLDKAERTANAWEMSFFCVGDSTARYIVKKGSIAVNGISLTVADCSESGDWFSAAVIPVTYGETTLRYLRPGDWVNLEGDILGKYVEKFTRGSTPADGQGGSSDELSMAFLMENGYL
jgi:riboflavin synthase